MFVSKLPYKQIKVNNGHTQGGNVFKYSRPMKHLGYPSYVVVFRLNEIIRQHSATFCSTLTMGRSHRIQQNHPNITMFSITSSPKSPDPSLAFKVPRVSRLSRWPPQLTVLTVVATATSTGESEASSLSSEDLLTPRGKWMCYKMGPKTSYKWRDMGPL